MQKDEITELFSEIGVLKKGHFRLSSGLHSDTYLQCAILQQYPDKNERICSVLAEQVKELRPTLVVGAAVGGIISCYELAKQLNCRCIFAERVNGSLTFRRNFRVKDNDRIVVIEDVITTGKTTKELIELIGKDGQKPLAICSIVNRNKDKATFSHPVFSVLDVDAHVWSPDECPLCDAGMELTQPGSRHLHSK